MRQLPILLGLSAATCLVVLSGQISQAINMPISAVEGQCWSQEGGVGRLLSNSCTKQECRDLGGRSWCPVGGGCEDL